jgi:hypothetical protein
MSLRLAQARIVIIGSLLQNAEYHLTLRSDPTFKGVGGFLVRSMGSTSWAAVIKKQPLITDAMEQG